MLEDISADKFEKLRHEALSNLCSDIKFAEMKLSHMISSKVEIVSMLTEQLIKKQQHILE